MFPTQMKLIGFVSLLLTTGSQCLAGQRVVPERAKAESFKVSFNGETISAYCLVIDAREEAEKQADIEAGRLKGPVIVFFQGHAQRPVDAYELTSKLALFSKSGVVVIPVCDTPYGDEGAWRGDRGKEIVLMEVLRRVLCSKGIRIENFSAIQGPAARVDGNGTDDAQCQISSGLVPVGWSHGGILARRMAQSYPGAVVALGQVCPAGYERRGPLKLTVRFAGEALRISRIAPSKGHTMDSLKSAWGFTKGFAGDFARSLPAALLDLSPSKVLRTGRDISDCSLYADSSSLGELTTGRIAVIFGADDSCMNPGRIIGTNGSGGIPPDLEKRFWETFYAGSSRPGATLILKVLPGTHLAPVTHSDLYVKTLLEGIGQHIGTS